MNENDIKALFPEGVETITISKNDYDRLYGQLTYENIILQSKIDKAIEFINSKHNWYGDEEEDNEDYLFELEDFEQLLSILKEDK